MFKDSDFISTDEVPGPTKEDIRTLAISKLELSHDDTVMDIGCGTGGITVELSKIAKKVISVDRNKEAIELTKKNLRKLSPDAKVDLINDEAAFALKIQKEIDGVIVGGSGGDLDRILELAKEKLTPNGRIVVTAILIETKMEAVKKLKELGYNVEFIEVSIAKGKIMDRGTMLLAQNPISIIYTVD